MAFVLYYFFIIHLSLSSHSATPSPLLRILLYLLPLSNRPLSSEGWVPMWVYFVLGSGMGQVTVWVVGMAAWWVAAS